MTDRSETFIHTFDVWSSTISPADLVMLTALLTLDSNTTEAEAQTDADEAEVNGFSQSWPGLKQVTVGPGGTGWLKDPATDNVTMGPGGNGW